MATLNNLHKTTDDINKDDRVDKMLTHFEQAGARADAVAKQAGALLASLTPSFNQTAVNLAQMSDTLKRQPWRVIWPTTKKYEGATPEVVPVAVPARAARDRRRVREASAAATPAVVRSGPLLTD